MSVSPCPFLLEGYQPNACAIESLTFRALLTVNLLAVLLRLDMLMLSREWPEVACEVNDMTDGAIKDLAVVYCLWADWERGTEWKRGACTKSSHPRWCHPRITNCHAWRAHV